MSNYSAEKIRLVLEAAFDADEIRTFATDVNADKAYQKVAKNWPSTTDRATFVTELIKASTDLDKLVRDVVDNVEERSPKKYFDVRRILAGQAKTAIIGKNELFNSLKKINFETEFGLGQKVCGHSRIASFWLHGDLMSGQDMLHKRLVDKIGGSGLVWPIDMRSHDSAKTAESAWTQIGAFVTEIAEATVNERPKIIEEIARMATRENIVIILRGASNMVDLPKWADEFWKSLVEATKQVMDDSSSGFLVLFLIDYLNSELAPPQLTEAQNKLKEYHKNLGLTFGVEWKPEEFMAYKPVCLSVSSLFDDTVLNKWINNTDELPLTLARQLENSQVNYKDRRPMCVYADIVKTCNQNWDEISSWLK